MVIDVLSSKGPGLADSVVEHEEELAEADLSVSSVELVLDSDSEVLFGFPGNSKFEFEQFLVEDIDFTGISEHEALVESGAFSVQNSLLDVIEPELSVDVLVLVPDTSVPRLSTGLWDGLEVAKVVSPQSIAASVLGEIVLALAGDGAVVLVDDFGLGVSSFVGLDFEFEGKFALVVGVGEANFGGS